MLRNLARHTTKDKLLEMLKEYGNVTSINLVMDKETRKSKGFGFAEMPNKIEAKKAIKALNGKIVDGEKIRVKTVATSRSKRR